MPSAWLLHQFGQNAPLSPASIPPQQGCPPPLPSPPPPHPPLPPTCIDTSSARMPSRAACSASTWQYSSCTLALTSAQASALAWEERKEKGRGGGGFTHQAVEEVHHTGGSRGEAPVLLQVK